MYYLGFQIILEEPITVFSVLMPDLSGCTSAGADREEIDVDINETIKCYLQGLNEDRIDV